jgi:hypothetical protein
MYKSIIFILPIFVLSYQNAVQCITDNKIPDMDSKSESCGLVSVLLPNDNPVSGYNIMVVYIIINKITKAYYIGITNGNKKNYFGSGYALADNIIKYGKENFKKSIIEYCPDRIIASEMERYWIGYAKEKWPNYKCLNLTSGGDNMYTLSTESAEKIKQSLIKYYQQHPELKEKYSQHAKQTLCKYVQEHRDESKLKVPLIEYSKIIYDFIHYHKNCVQIAKEYGVHKSYISLIVKSFNTRGHKGTISSFARLNETSVLNIREERKINPSTSFKVLAEKYRVSYTTIWRIINRITWDHI